MKWHGWHLRSKTVVYLLMVSFFLCASLGVYGNAGGHVGSVDMILVRSGSFMMGDEVGDLPNDCQPVHKVTLTYDFWIGRYPITFDQYDLFCEKVGKDKPSDADWYGYAMGRGSKPVVNVNWVDALAFCNWLSKQEGLSLAYDPDGNLLDSKGMKTTDIKKVQGYRLPTEAEWEYAARGGAHAGSRFLFSGSDTLNEVGWFWQNSGDQWLVGTDYDWDWDKMQNNNSKTQIVGSKMPNELGIYDMSGNVWEWCYDRYYGNYSYYGNRSLDNVTNPIGPFPELPSELHWSRIQRGGHWASLPKFCRIAMRSENSSPRGGNTYLGFRIVKTVVP